MRRRSNRARTAARLFVWAVFLFFGGAAGMARAEVLPLKTYVSSDGLLYESVRRIYQDSRGLMWFSTPIGVSRFDGYQFTNYTMEDGLANPGITDMIESDGGVYWLGSVATGVYRFDSHFKDPARPGKPTFVHYEINPAGADSVNLFFKTRSGQVFAATPSGLFALNDSEPERKFSRVELKIPGAEENKTSVSALAEDADGNLWIGHQFGLTRRLPDGANVHYEIQPAGATDWVRSLYADAQNRLWIITDRRGLAVFNPESSDSINPADAAKRQIKPAAEFSDGLEKGAGYFFKAEEIPADGTFSTVRGTADGKLWVGTNSKGLLVFEQKGFSLYTKANGLCDDRVHSITEDNFGNLWIGSYWGLMRLPRRGFVTYKTEDGLADTLVTNVFEDKSGAIYAVNQNWKINRFDGKRFTSGAPNLPKTVGNWRFHQVLLDSAGEWWVGTRKGLYRFPRVEKPEDLTTAQPVAVYTKNGNGLPSDDIYALFEDARGDVWFSFWSDITGRLTRWERASGNFYHYGASDGIPEKCFPSVFRRNSRGDVFIGCRTEDVIVYTQEGRFISYSSDSAIPERTIHDIFVDSRDRLWVGMGAAGLRRFDNPLTENPEAKKYTTAEGLSEIHIQYIAEDDFGKIYYVTARGMDRLDPETGEIKYFSSGDGLAAAGTGRAIRDRNGALWLATARGVSRFTPETEQNFPAPPVFISRLKIAGKDYPLAPLGETEISDLELEPEEKQLEIDFYGLSLASGEALRYQYTIDGKTWSEPTPQRSVTLNLAPGDYDFRVRAVKSDGSYSPNETKFSFTTLPLIYKRWWFLIIATVLAALVIYAFYRNRLRRLVELEKVRTRMATDLHDDIGSSLSQIAILSEVVRQKVGAGGANEPLNMIADTSREMVDSMSDIVWAINPQKDHLTDLVQRMRRFAEDMLDAQDIAYRFYFDDTTPDISLGADVRREVYLIFKETINNLAKHARATEAVISITVNKDLLVIEVKDNGRGFDTAAELDGYGGNGLPNMKRRAVGLGGKFEIVSAENTGTTVLLEIPFRQSSAGKRVWKKF